MNRFARIMGCFSFRHVENQSALATFSVQVIQLNEFTQENQKRFSINIKFDVQMEFEFNEFNVFPILGEFNILKNVSEIEECYQSSLNQVVSQKFPLEFFQVQITGR